MFFNPIWRLATDCDSKCLDIVLRERLKTKQYLAVITETISLSSLPVFITIQVINRRDISLRIPILFQTEYRLVHCRCYFPIHHYTGFLMTRSVNWNKSCHQQPTVHVCQFLRHFIRNIYCLVKREKNKIFSPLVL